MSSPPTSSPAPTLDDYLADYQVLNRTELYQLCKQRGLPVSPADSRETLIGVFADVLDRAPASVVNPLDRWRTAMARFIDDHWRMLEPQLTCPARTRDPRACFGCLDVQVVACVVDNDELLLPYMRDE